MFRPLTTGFLIFPGFAMACLTSMIEPMRAANEIAGKKAFDWKLVAATQDKVQSSALIEFEPNQTLAEIQHLDFLVVWSSTGFVDGYGLRDCSPSVAALS